MKSSRRNSCIEDKIGKVFLIQDSYCERVLVILGGTREINFFKSGLELNTDFNMMIKAINGFDFFMMKSLVILVENETVLSNLYNWAIDFLQKYSLDITIDILSRLKTSAKKKAKQEGVNGEVQNKLINNKEFFSRKTSIMDSTKETSITQDKIPESLEKEKIHQATLSPRDNKDLQELNEDGEITTKETNIISDLNNISNVVKKKDRKFTDILQTYETDKTSPLINDLNSKSSELMLKSNHHSQTSLNKLSNSIYEENTSSHSKKDSKSNNYNKRENTSNQNKDKEELSPTRRRQSHHQIDGELNQENEDHLSSLNKYNLRNVSLPPSFRHNNFSFYYEKEDDCLNNKAKFNKERHYKFIKENISKVKITPSKKYNKNVFNNNKYDYSNVTNVYSNDSSCTFYYSSSNSKKNHSEESNGCKDKTQLTSADTNEDISNFNNPSSNIKNKYTVSNLLEIYFKMNGSNINTISNNNINDFINHSFPNNNKNPYIDDITALVTTLNEDTNNNKDKLLNSTLTSTNIPSIFENNKTSVIIEEHHEKEIEEGDDNEEEYGQLIRKPNLSKEKNPRFIEEIMIPTNTPNKLFHLKQSIRRKTTSANTAFKNLTCLDNCSCFKSNNGFYPNNKFTGKESIKNSSSNSLLTSSNRKSFAKNKSFFSNQKENLSKYGHYRTYTDANKKEESIAFTSSINNNNNKGNNNNTNSNPTTESTFNHNDVTNLTSNNDINSNLVQNTQQYNSFNYNSLRQRAMTYTQTDNYSNYYENNENYYNDYNSNYSTTYKPKKKSYVGSSSYFNNYNSNYNSFYSNNKIKKKIW